MAKFGIIYLFLFFSWARSEVQVKTVEVRISTIHARYVPANVDIETKPHRENEPLLVVFSNDKKKVRADSFIFLSSLVFE